MISWLTMTDINPGRTVLSEQPRSLYDSQIHDKFVCLWKGDEDFSSGWVRRGEEREDVGSQQSSQGRGRLTWTHCPGAQPHLTYSVWGRCPCASSPALASILKGLFCDFLTHFHPLSHAVRSCPKAEILPRSFFPSPPDTLLPLQAYTCVFLHQVPNVSNLPQVVSWLFPTSAWRGQIPICSLFCSV